MSNSRTFHSKEDVTISSERLQNLGLCWALRVFEQEGSLLCPICNDTARAPVFSVTSEGLLHSVASYDTQEDTEDLF
jgi:hypothetical protein